MVKRVYLKPMLMVIGLETGSILQETSYKPADDEPSLPIEKGNPTESEDGDY